MLRPSRASLALIRSLMLGAAAVTTTVAASSVLVACSDDTQPEYWVEKLDDPQWRPRAVKRLTQFLDDALTRADNNIEDPQVKALEDKLVAPLTQVYVESYGDLDTKTRVTLIKLLADFRDDRAIPALKKAFEEFAKRPRETKDEQDIKWAIRAYGDMKSKELAGPVLAAFEALKAHTQLGGITYKDYSKGMVNAPDPAWEGPLIEKLGGKIKHPTTGKNKTQQRDLIDPYRDELFWQVTAAQILGELKSTKAVEPLIKVVVDPGKSDIATTALLALVKIGKPAVERAVKMFSEDDALVKYAKERIKDATDASKEPEGNPVMAQAAAIIGMTGRSDGIKPLLDALNGKIKDEDKALLARELPKLPPTDESKEAFKKAYESLSADTTVQGTPAQLLLAEAVTGYFDPGMVDWLLAQAASAKGSSDVKTALQQTLTVSAMKLAKADQWDKVVAAAKKYKLEDDKKKLLTDIVDPVVKACGDKVDCYLTQVEKTDNQSEANQLAGIKAGYMVGVLGDAKARDALVERLPSLENSAVNFAAVSSIDTLSPKAAPEVVTKLEELIEKNEKSADAGKLANNGPLKQLAYRISVR